MEIVEEHGKVQIDDKNAPDMRREYDQLSRDTMDRRIHHRGRHTSHAPEPDETQR